MTLRVLQFGATGQLGRALLGRADDALHIQALDRAVADFSEPQACADQIAGAAADVVVIAAAYTKVDQAESEPDAARRVNVEGPAAIAQAAAAVGAPVVYVSTDYVFDGAGGAPYRETAATGPLNVYGASKLEGERAVLAAQPVSAIVRTSWVFDAQGANFLRTMLRLGAERDQMRIVDDQKGAPTPASALAEAVLAVAKGFAEAPDDPERRGVFHFQGAPHASWADFAEVIFTAAEPFWGRRPEIARIPSAEYPTPAPRPLDTRLDCARIRALYGLKPPDWRAAAVADVRAALT